LEGLAIEDVCIFYGRLVYFVAIWYIFPVLVHCVTKNLATLRQLMTKYIKRDDIPGDKKTATKKVICINSPLWHYIPGMPDFL
jgi:hypothetical protein